MEDESRPLPSNWARQYDPQTHHQFFVDTSSSPPRSIWHHPYDDEGYLSSLSAGERARINKPHHSMPNRADMEAESSTDEVTGVHKLGRKIKDKLTSSTHEQREVERRKREEEEARLYRQHQHIRQQMSKAAETGEPQLLGNDRDGKEVWIEPPTAGYGRGGYGGGFGGGLGGTGYAMDPYASNVYGRPNARYLRPQQPYARPYGGGYGGGYGLPIGMGLGGGMLLGGLMF